MRGMLAIAEMVAQGWTATIVMDHETIVGARGAWGGGGVKSSSKVLMMPPPADARRIVRLDSLDSTNTDKKEHSTKA